MAARDNQALKRLGGGRWQTRDGRFTIEPQSGTWVVVDAEATDELGLPLVRGPFGTLASARDAIARSREEPSPTSPLGEALTRAGEDTAEVADGTPAGARERGRRRRAATESEATRRAADPASEPEPPEPEPPGPERAEPEPAEPEAPSEPAWLVGLGRRDRRQVDALVQRLSAAGVPEPLDIARVEIVDDEPAVARVALLRRLAEVASRASTAEEAVAATIGELIAGEDPALEVSWRLVDGEGRAVERLAHQE